jgi:hypothetical protein
MRCGNSSGGPANNGPVVVKNPCQFQGRALSPYDYSTSGQQAKNSTTNFVLDVSMGFLPVITIRSRLHLEIYFKIKLTLAFLGGAD